jgi:hypothetical protein
LSRPCLFDIVDRYDGAPDLIRICYTLLAVDGTGDP